MILLFYKDLCEDKMVLNVTRDLSYNLTSPNYPGRLPLLLNCYWIITAIDDGLPIATFIDFKLRYLIHFIDFAAAANATDADNAEEFYYVFKDSAPSSIMTFTKTMVILFRTSAVVVDPPVGFVLEISTQSFNCKLRCQISVCIKMLTIKPILIVR